MDKRTEKVRENVISIISFWNEYNNIPANLMIPTDAGWHKRISDIYHQEAPKTLTKLVLQLNVANDPYLEYRDYDENEVEFISIIRSINQSPLLWDDAFALHGDNDRVKFLLDQSTFQISEFYRSLINIKKM